MLATLDRMPVPAWLMQAGDTGGTTLPVRELLSDSLYYPACCIDGMPIRLLNGNVVSFVYADYLMREDMLHAQLARRSFRGYTPVFQRSVAAAELVPVGWSPTVVPTAGIERLKYWQRNAEPFAQWSVWRRDEGLTDAHGAELFSLLYLAGEMSATYQGLYYHHRILPKVLALYNPGCFGGEWESSAHADSFFHKVVAGHPCGLPDYFLTEYYMHTHACFPEYSNLIDGTLPRGRLYSLKNNG